MKNLDKRYIAGLFDGEGSITIHKCFDSKNAHKNGHKSTFGYLHKPKIRLGMTEAEVIINYLKERYGGSIYLRSYGNEYKDLLLWTLQGEKGITNFLKEISPYLIVKKRQANIVNDFYKNMTTQKDWKSPTMPKLEAERREKLYIEIHKLNKKCRDITNRD